MEPDFTGSKAAIYIGAQLLMYQRDDLEGLPFRGMWDFAGGGREGEEDPFACLAREVSEEFGLTVQESDIRWARAFPAMSDPSQTAWFYVLALPQVRAQDIRFGIEGQRWALMDPLDVAKLPNLIPALRDRLTLWLHEAGCDLI